VLLPHLLSRPQPGTCRTAPAALLLPPLLLLLQCRLLCSSGSACSEPGPALLVLVEGAP
jgi:hypothetical protein